LSLQVHYEKADVVDSFTASQIGMTY